MKYFISILTVVVVSNLYGQPWYSKVFDPFHGGQESGKVLVQDNDTIYFRGGGVCSEGNSLCSIVGAYSPELNDFVKLNLLENVQTGGKSLMINSSGLFLSSQESNLNNNVSLNQIDKHNLQLIDSINLKLELPNYFYYTISNSIKFGNSLIVGAHALDSLIYINLQGWNNYQVSAIFFVVDSSLLVDTTIIIPPTSGAYLLIEDMTIGNDSLLYVTFSERYLKINQPNNYLITHRVIYGFDQYFNKVFQWFGPDYENQESISCITTGTDSTIYINYEHDFRSYILALNIDGSTKWECLIDSTIGDNLYSIRNLLIAENGDLVGAGTISSVVDELGESGFIFRVNDNGKLLWKKVIRINKGQDETVPEIFPFQSNFEDIIELQNSDLLATGFVRQFVGLNNPNGPYDFDIWMVRTNSEGCLWENCPYIQDINYKRSYIPLVSSMNEWVDETTPIIGPRTIYRYSFSIDSVLFNNSYYYELLYSKNISDPWKSTGKYYREENGKVFNFIEGQSDPVKLVYDFNLNIGDTLIPYSDGIYARREVIRTGFVELLDGIARKYLIISCDPEGSGDTTMWVEGIGDIDRFFWAESFCSNFDDGGYGDLHCYSTNGQTVYLKPGLENCYISSVETVDEDDFKIFPNPCSDYLNILNEDGYIIDNIKVFDVVGNVVIESENKTSNLKLNISRLSPGVYIGILRSSNNLIKSFKFVVSK